MRFNLLQLRLINNYQKNFPLVIRPFLQIAHEQSCEEKEVLQFYKSLNEQKIISRIGPVFKPHSIGCSILVAMKVPDNEIDKIANYLSQYDEINHNYQREGIYNIWFVLTCETKIQEEEILAQIEKDTEISTLRLPMVKSYHCNLAFEITS